MKMDFEEQVRPLIRSATHFAHHLMGTNWEDAEDMVQQALMKAYKNESQFHGQSKFSTWFFQILKNEVLMEHRRRNGGGKYRDNKTRNKRIPLSNRVSLSEVYGVVSLDPDPERIYATKELLLKASPKNLPKQLASLILQKYYGWTDRELSEKFYVPEGTIKSRIFRALKQFKENINELPIH